MEACTTDGRRDVVRVNRAPGHPEHELDWMEVRGKFADCARHASLDAAQADAAFERLAHLERCENFSDIVGLLVKR